MSPDTSWSQPRQQPVTPPAQETPPTLALDGYCPVRLLEQKNSWQRGDARWGAIHRGRTYLFAGQDEQGRFLSDPDRYAPIISGNDIVIATEQGQAVAGKREHGLFFGERIHLFSCEETLAKFSQNPAVYTAAARRIEQGSRQNTADRRANSGNGLPAQQSGGRPGAPAWMNGGSYR